MASIEDSERLKRTAEIVSVDVECVRFETAIDLSTNKQSSTGGALNQCLLIFVPYLDDTRRSSKNWVSSVMIYRAEKKYVSQLHNPTRAFFLYLNANFPAKTLKGILSYHKLRS